VVGLVEVVEERLLCRGRRVELVQRVYSYGGRRFLRDVVRFGQSVAVVPLLGREVILIRQFRAPVGGWVLEIPAGRVEPGESLEEAATRELIEEVGYRPRRLERLVSLYMSPGYSDEVLHIYLATDLEYVGSSPEPGELIEVVRLDIEKALECVLGGVADAKTAVALLTLRLKLLGGLPRL
jgi:ADP-ribose pyrophosphatase